MEWGEIPAEYRNQIVTGDARQLSERIPDESIDLVFCDPVYDRIDDYRWLAETAARVLKPDRACLALVDTRHAAHAQLAMEQGGLTYQWTLYYTIPGKPGALHLYGVYPCTTVCLLFAKGHKKASPYIPDTLVSYDAPDNGFKWQKNIGIVRRWIECFTGMGDVVADFFGGSGSTAVACKQAQRNFILFEIDSERAEMAQRRVAATPVKPPLPGLLAVQPALMGG
jgi:tRNA1(Val) A37 N6-methylase TrmN6